MSPAIATCGWCKFSKYLTNWSHMTFELHVWPLISWTQYEGSFIISINQLWFQMDPNFSNEVNFTFWVYLTTWSLMTFKLDTWSLTAWTYKGFINYIWFQSDFRFSNDATFTFSAYLSQITFDLHMSPLTSSTNEGSYVASMAQLWLKSIKTCRSLSQMLTRFVCLFGFFSRQQTTTIHKTIPVCLSY